ncbi:hypothetical protein FSP39_008103 [Pinctada imbricata]|uniref:Uncharacterized protein n=1 Tax=Pinctada imbricata TaxID=66713 RepID=A0AA88YGY1_PINIB|nr:hypothetical protein FSP39_008103 [Pinctada imbricata]
MYLVSVGSTPEPNVTDVVNRTQFLSSQTSTCFDLDPANHLIHGQTYYVTVWAYNGGNKQLNVSSTSDGVLVDLTLPIPGEVIDGKGDNFTNLDFTSNAARVEVQWRDYDDPESQILDFQIQVYRARNHSTDFELLQDWVKFDNTTSSVTWRNFTFEHNDVVKTTLKTTNGALNTVTNTTDGFVVDLSPPDLLYIRDGLTTTDIDYQADSTQLSASFSYEDEESGVDQYQIQVYELYQGTRSQIVPATRNEWVNLTGSTLTSHTETGLSLREGGKYSMRVGALNKAGFLASFETNGVIIDQSDPMIYWLRVGVIGPAPESRIDGYVWQSDRQGIKASWAAADPQSGIVDYQLAVGTTQVYYYQTDAYWENAYLILGATDVLSWFSVGMETSHYISGLTLDLSNEITKLPAYHVSIRAENGAGQTSTTPTYSTPIYIYEDNTAGLVIDGPDGTETVVGGASVELTNDMDYTLDSSSVTVQFSGFESTVHGVMKFEQAVGTQPGGEEVLPFTEFGVIQAEEDNVTGDGIASSGYAHMNLALQANQTYYTSIRAVTNNGDVIQANSDGFIVDQSPPEIVFDSLSGYNTMEYNITPSSQIYVVSEDSLTASWHYNDTESEVVRAWYAVGTYPRGEDIVARQLITVDDTLSYTLVSGTVTPDVSGKPNIITVWAENSVGLVSEVMSGSIIFDVSSAQPGTVTCPKFAQSTVPLDCTWSGFIDTESPIVTYYVTMGTAQGNDDVFNNGTVAGDVQRFTIDGVFGQLQHGVSYFVTVTAVNKVGMEISAFSDVIGVDLTPPTFGRVIDLHSVYRLDNTNNTATVEMNKKVCDTDEECDALDAICTESLTSLSVTWQPFGDLESGIVELQVAVGTSAGGGQIKAFETIPLDSKHYTVGGLNLNGHRQVYVTVKAMNEAGLSSVATSNGIYMSYLSQGKEPLSPVGIMDVTEGAEIDVDFQTDPSTIMAQWDVSGDPCPVVKYEWAIQRLDGVVISDFLDTSMGTSGMNDALTMLNGETYINMVRVTNALGYQYILRSNGVTIQDTPLLPGNVYDGDIAGFDLNFIPSRTTISANWNGFGLSSDAIVQIDINSGNPGLQQDSNQLAAQDRSQRVAYYMVAVGTDRRYNKTRDDVVPYTNVGTNTSVTFYDLDLTPNTAIYYFTVIAFSKSFSKATVTSNGFYVGEDGGVAAGTITMPGACVGNDTELEVQYEGFFSNLDILMYYVAISNHTQAVGTNCKLVVEGGTMSDADRIALFNVLDVTNNGKNTYTLLTGLQLEQSQTYYVWVIGTDQAGECDMTYTTFMVDITEPTMGQISAGRTFDWGVTFNQDDTTVNVTWLGFEDPESGLSGYKVSLWRNVSCLTGSTTEVVQDWITLTGNYSFYQFVEQNLSSSSLYFVKLRAINCAGLETEIVTMPILIETSTPTAGTVKDGDDFTSNTLWSNNASQISGSFLHYPSLDPELCPSQSIQMKNPTWSTLTKQGFLDPYGEQWKIRYDPIYVIPAPVEDMITLKLLLTTDTSGNDIMGAGAIYRDAQMYGDGLTEFTLKAADQDGEAVTEILFWDGPEEGIASHKHQLLNVVFDNCECCFVNPIPATCGVCNCNQYLTEKGYFLNETFSTTTPGTTTTAKTDQGTPYNVVDAQGTSLLNKPDSNRVTMRQSCGVQLYSGHSTNETDKGTPYNVVDSQGTSLLYKPDSNRVTMRQSCGVQLYSANQVTNERAYVVSWCRFFNSTRETYKLRTDININPASGYYDYIIDFEVRSEGSILPTWCMVFYAQGVKINQLCGIPHLSSNTYLFLHVFKKDNSLPTHSNKFTSWAAYASFSHINVPPPVETLCRSGTQFRSGTNPVVLYEAGIGTSPLTTNVLEYRNISAPCIPCYNDCSHFICNATCSTNETLVTFTLDDLDLQSYQLSLNSTEDEYVPFYITVRMTTVTGDQAISSSNGFYVDTTPPVFDSDIMAQEIYYDVSQGVSVPVRYQSSNSTIKSIWKCNDNESGIIDYTWAIGSTPGAEDIQNYTSVGQNIVGVNSRLEGVLEHNTTYFVSVVCTNGAGLTAQYMDQQGVTVILELPFLDSINITIPDTDSFDLYFSTSTNFSYYVIPRNAQYQYSQESIGVTFSKSLDPTVVRYDFCVGTEEFADDVVPCTWVSYNTSGSAKVKNGFLYVNDVPVRNLSDLMPVQDFTSVTTRDNTFRMPVGQTLFVMIRLCNLAGQCTNKSAGSSFILANYTVVLNSHNGSVINYVDNIVTSRKRATTMLNFFTTDVLDPGQTIAYTPLAEADLTTDYGSGASLNFISYIVNPNDTMDMVDRFLYNRFESYSYAFSIATLGNLPLPGPLTFVYTDPNALATNGSRALLIHWNPVMQHWESSSKTCTDLDPQEQEDYDEMTQQSIVKVCNTYRNTTPIENASSILDFDENHLYRPTLFVLSSVNAEIYNTPPQLNSSANITLLEDFGTVEYQLLAVDEENDAVNFEFDGNSADLLTIGTVEMDYTGFLRFIPCADCSGSESFTIILRENQTDPAIPVMSSTAEIFITVIPVNDAPKVFVSRFGESLTSADPTEPVRVFLEAKKAWNQNQWNDTVKVLVGAFDTELGEYLTYSILQPSAGTVRVTQVSRAVPTLDDTCDDVLTETMMLCADNYTQTLPHAGNRMSWMTFVLEFDQPMDIIGNYSTSIYFEDSNNGTSPPITIIFTILDFPCWYGASCAPASIYPCQDTHRSHSFDLYYICVCAPGYTSTYCTVEIDECASNPCIPPLTCIDKVNGYECTCESSNPNCILQPWMIALMVIGGLLLIVFIGVGIYRYRFKRA